MELMRHLLSMGLLVSFHVPHHGLFTLRSQQSYRSKRKTLFFAWVKMSPCQSLETFAINTYYYCQANSKCSIIYKKIIAKTGTGNREEMMTVSYSTNKVKSDLLPIAKTT